MGSQAKKHHYVPQSVLRGFSNDREQKHVYVFDKSNLRSFSSPIRDAGCENQFNTIEVNGQSVSFEGLFQTNDDELARLLKTILTNNSLAQLTARERITLCEVVAAQIIRTKMARTTSRSIVEQLSQSLKEAGIDPCNVAGFSSPTEQEIRRAALASFLDLQGIIKSLQEKRPILIRNTESKVFWCSDNPVVFHNSFPYGERGLSASGIEIYFPISSYLVVGFFCPSIEWKIRKLLTRENPGVDRQKYEDISRGLQEGNA